METIETTTQDVMELDHDGTLKITLPSFDGPRLLSLQRALLLAIEEVGCCERSGSEEYRNTMFELTWLFRALMLDESQMNVALGRRAFTSPKKKNKDLKDFMHYDHDARTLMVVLQAFDGSRLRSLHKALLLGIEEVGYCERSDGEDYRDAIFHLTWLLRAIMLNEEQTAMGLKLKDEHPR